MTYSLIDRLADIGTPTAEEAIAEITRLTSALAYGSSYKESDIDALQNKMASLISALAASEEARRAERAAVVRECARKTKERAAYEDSFASLYKEQDPEKYTITSYAAHVLRGHTNAILALATDADNAALDKLLREARKEALLQAAAIANRQSWEHGGRHFDGPEMNSRAIEDAILAALEVPQ